VENLFIRCLTKKIVRLCPVLFTLIHPAFAEDLFSNTYLVEIKQGSELSDTVNFYASGGVESANGSFISYSPWYTNTWTDARVTFMTQFAPSFGIIWGFSTGEHGAKYRIDPSLKLGVAYFTEINKRSSLSLRFTTIIGGDLTESACVGDYGDVGGVVPVNCRLAATPMNPQDTLQYLFNAHPYNQTVLKVEYKYFF
jgi:hypothetical protein